MGFVGKNYAVLRRKVGWGFETFKAFNLAHLAKQGWRLQQNPNSLVHRVMKAKYFPNTSFLEAHMGRKPSYIWRSIMAAKIIIHEGAR